MAEPDARRLGPALTAALVIAALLRVLYHCSYLAEVPFALATFSDGRQYELAAIDVLEHPPWGTQPFYLQGLYAYQMALPMMIRQWVSLALLLQLAIAGLTHAWFFRAMQRWRGRVEAGWATLALLAFPMLAFYENKFLTASLTVTASVGVLWAAVRCRDAGAGWWTVLGGLAGIAVLARPNLAVVVPFLAVAGWRHATTGRGARLGLLVLGLLLTLGPMAVRNAQVTGRATVMPAHGGGTSFYIGNNASARGVWNTAGGLLSGDVSHERDELRQTLGVPASDDADTEIAAIGRALYARAWEEITDDPGRWLWLEVRKLWLMAGNEPLTQDYDVLGEREMLSSSPRIGLPFGVALAFALFGIGPLRKAAGEDVVLWSLLGLAVGTVAANLLYFTSAQHRLPLVVPFAVCVPSGVRAVRAAVQQRRWPAVVAFAVLVAASFWPRSRRDAPSAVHYYNLSVAWVYVGQPSRGLQALDRALEIRPGHPVIRLERASMLRRGGAFARARTDLDVLEAQGSLPGWVRERVVDERRRLATLDP
ncbi:MAG: hypothetical protein AAGA54_30110 [Myxococcota bacterium]